jgi:protoporphyrinogen oxidase
MQDYQYIILGAGVSGLAFAQTLMDRGVDSFILLEKEESAGGLCRSEMVDGFPLDIGGGHFLDTRNKDVLRFLFRFLPEHEWREFSRKSTIRIRSHEIDYPFESNLWQFPVSTQLDYLESAAKAGSVRGEPEPESFREWIIWKFGSKISSDYMLPYNSKIWSMDIGRLSTTWLHKLPLVSFREILQSTMLKEPAGKIPAHARFLYPVKSGYGEVWRRIAASLGNRIRYSTCVNELIPDSRIINGAYRAKTIINTIPWQYLMQCRGIPPDVLNAVKNLEYTSIKVSYHPEEMKSPAHWIYVPDETTTYHRILCRSNFIPGSHGYWTETNLKRANGEGGWSCVNKFAYPVNTADREKHIGIVSEWARSKSIYPLGRWGQWEHINSDVAVARAVEAAEYLIRDNESDQELIRNAS